MERKKSRISKKYDTNWRENNPKYMKNWYEKNKMREKNLTGVNLKDGYFESLTDETEQLLINENIPL